MRADRISVGSTLPPLLQVQFMTAPAGGMYFNGQQPNFATGPGFSPSPQNGIIIIIVFAIITTTTTTTISTIIIIIMMMTTTTTMRRRRRSDDDDDDDDNDDDDQ